MQRKKKKLLPKVTQRDVFSNTATFVTSLCLTPKIALVIDQFWGILELVNLIK